MAKVKKKKTPLIEAFLLSIVVTLFAFYMILSFVETYTLQKDLFANLIGFGTKKESFLSLSYESKLLFGIGAALLFVGFIAILRKDSKGYKDAAWHGAYGSAVFSTLDDFRENGYVAPVNKSKWHPKNPYIALAASEGIILGREGGQLMIIPPDSKLDNRNVLVVGSSGSSKGQAFVINNIINNRTSSIVVTDPKGELYKLTSDIKRDQGFKVYQIDFLNLEGDGYNPLDYIETDLDAKRVALTIARNSAKDDKEDHWFSKGVELLTGLILYVKEEYESPSIPIEVKREFNKANEDENYLQELCGNIGEEHVAYAYLKDAAVAKGNERQSIFSTFTKHVGIFSSKKVAQLTQKSDFKFDYLQEEISILYIKIPIKDNPVAALTATFFDQFISRMYSIGDMYDAKLPLPTIALFDEFANLGKLNEFDNTLSTCRGYDFSIVTIVQDFAQLEKTYGKENARTIISNHDTTLFLRTKDTETAKYFEALAGDTTITYKTKGSSTSGNSILPLSSSSSSSTNENIVKKPLISQSQLLQMPSDACYAFLAGRVIELEKAYQSTIYKDFITTTEVVVRDGIKRYKFPYIYPQNRQEYIKRFNFNPREEKVGVMTETDEVTMFAPTEDEETVIETNNTQIPQKAPQSTLSTLIDDFMIKTELNAVKKIVQPQKDVTQKDEETTNEEQPLEVVVEPFSMPEVIEITNNLINVKKEQFNETSDPQALQELKELTALNKLANETNEIMVELKVCEEISELLELEDNETPVEMVNVETDESPKEVVESEDIAELKALLAEEPVETKKEGNINDLLPY